MKTPKIFIVRIIPLLFLFLHGLFVNAQLLNGSFESWIQESNGTDVPANWDYLLPNEDDAIQPTEIASDGFLALRISSSNRVEGTQVGPAHLGSKIYPLGLTNRLIFDYMIDSLEGESTGKIEIYHKNNQGDFRLLSEKYFVQQSKEFVTETFDFVLPYIDSIVIVLIAENHYIPFGFDGFISILIDNVMLEYTSNTLNNAQCNCTLNSNILSNNMIYLNEECSKKTLKYILLSIEGTVFGAGHLTANEIPCSTKGISFLILYSDRDFTRIYKLINHQY
jgi:hypothetical protein